MYKERCRVPMEMRKRLAGNKRKDIELVDDDEISSYVRLQSPI
jgi:hypothetical protein